MLPKLNGWQRIGIVLSVGWVIFILGVMVTVYSGINGIEKGLRKRPCPELSKDFFDWYDKKANKKLSIWDGKEPVACDTLVKRAKVLEKEAKSGEIDPELRMDYSGLGFALFIPIVALWVISYLFVWLVKWVAKGFQ